MVFRVNHGTLVVNVRVFYFLKRQNPIKTVRRDFFKELSSETTEFKQTNVAWDI